MDSQKQKNQTIQRLVILAILLGIALYIFHLTKNDNKKFFETYKAFQDNEVLQCKHSLVSQKKNWSLIHNSYLITNGETIYHLNICKRVKGL